VFRRVETLGLFAIGRDTESLWGKAAARFSIGAVCTSFQELHLRVQQTVSGKIGFFLFERNAQYG